MQKRPSEIRYRFFRRPFYFTRVYPYGLFWRSLPHTMKISRLTIKNIMPY
ncbi:hypothetical protein l11_17740 [Neisseria weaveri LMG 5135]|nr:hypothetical protein l11_17740 [Neisseria weaveri LMG 5135]